VWHLVSTVSARVGVDVPTAALLDATFPPASVTGTPNLRARQLLRGWEPHRRGVYRGTVGLASAAASRRTPIPTASGTNACTGPHRSSGIQPAPFNKDLRQPFRLADHQSVASVDRDKGLNPADSLDAGPLLFDRMSTVARGQYPGARRFGGRDASGWNRPAMNRRRARGTPLKNTNLGNPAGTLLGAPLLALRRAVSAAGQTTTSTMAAPS
jgi:hypothetical protein